MEKILIEHHPDEKRIQELGIRTWPIWTKEISEFPWSYDKQETCYFLEGEVLVTSDSGDSVDIGKGDLVTFPQGLTCTWRIKRNVKKHYFFG